MRFNTLDIERDLEEQGYQLHSYDVVVASFVVHATRNLKDTLTNIRQLLRPGGFLLLLEVTNLSLARISFIFGSLPGWWLGEEPYRRYTPCVEKSTWEELLLESGFSGIDTVTPDQDPLPFPVSAIVSQAINDEVSFLREPLNSDDTHPSRASSSMLLIVGGQSNHVSKLAKVIKRFVDPYFDRGISEVPSLENLQSSSFDPSSTIALVLADLDGAVFDDLNEQRFKGLKILFNNAERIYWITSESRDNNPFHLMSIGFGRSMLMEMPHVRTQYVDITDVSPASGFKVAEALLRFDALTSDTETSQSKRTLWQLEPELCLARDKQLVHRMILDVEKNYRYNSIRREIALEEEVGAENPVKVSIGPGGYRLMQQRTRKGSFQDNTVLVDTRFSTLSAMELGSSSSMHISLGSAAKDGRAMACLTETLASRQCVPNKLVVECQQTSPKYLATLVTALLAGAIVQTSFDYVVAVEPDEDLAFAIRAHATSKPLSLIFLTTDATKTQPHHHYIHHHVGIHELDRVMPRGCRQVWLTGRAQQVESRIATWARSREADGADLLPITRAYRSPQYTSTYLHSLLQSSISIATKLRQANFEVLTLNSLAKLSPNKARDLNLQILDWSPTKAPVIVEPVDRHVMLRGDRTYWLVGLSRSLGLSLCNWMIDQGAKHVVISSRSPVIDRAALEALKQKGANVKILAWSVLIAVEKCKMTLCDASEC